MSNGTDVLTITFNQDGGATSGLVSIWCILVERDVALKTTTLRNSSRLPLKPLQGRLITLFYILFLRGGSTIGRVLCYRFTVCLGVGGGGWTQRAQRAQITRQTWTHTVGHTGVMSAVHTEGTDNQSGRGPLGNCQLYIQRALTTSREKAGKAGHRGHRQLVGQCPTGVLSSVHTVGTGNHLGEAGEAGHRGHRQPDRQRTHIVRHTGPLEHCQLYIQRAHTSQTRGTQ